MSTTIEPMTAEQYLMSIDGDYSPAEHNHQFYKRFYQDGNTLDFYETCECEEIN